jgi:hypothetical protein
MSTLHQQPKPRPRPPRLALRGRAGAVAKLVAFVALATVLVAGPSLSRPDAAEASITVFPSLIDVKRAPGGVAVGTFNVRLERERSRRFEVEIQDAVQEPEGGFSYRPVRGSPFSASSWVTVWPHSFRGGANRVQPVEYRLRVPRNAEPGDHVTSLTLRRIPRRGRGVAVVKAISVRLTVRVKGTIREQIAIEPPDAPNTTGGGPVTVSTRVRNSGNVLLDFERGNKGALEIVDGAERKASLPFRGSLFPGQTRSFRLAWQDPPLLGRFKARAAVKTAKGLTERADGFWVLPLRPAAALILIALAAIVLASGRLGRRRQPAMEKLRSADVAHDA